MEITYKLEELDAVAAKIIKKAENKILLFKGEMGAGKTTLIKEIVKQLGSNDRVSSPTFSLVNEYTSENGPIYHFDFHRIEDISEAYDMGFEEYVFSDAWKLIEWPEKIMELLPEKFVCAEIKTIANDLRKLQIAPNN
ncbi:MAG TPA: tRNA (adenosine(37)-N6)-threonylcarbamoyltransferase complex ATPase subunit type 1 TsaE [Flavobacteriaceae bacterium]|nr:tRNA (adenosine(37)-N6)-threonylcarbamoyltransferase complex ATPase subunit type 1 TsaE [Flavobacteriaceae bacterium]